MVEDLSNIKKSNLIIKSISQTHRILWSKNNLDYLGEHIKHPYILQCLIGRLNKIYWFLHSTKTLFSMEEFDCVDSFSWTSLKLIHSRLNLLEIKLLIGDYINQKCVLWLKYTSDLYKL